MLDFSFVEKKLLQLGCFATVNMWNGQLWTD